MCDGRPHGAASLRPSDLLSRLQGVKLIFVGDSVMREFAEAVMCHFQDHLAHDGTAWSAWPKQFGQQCAQAPQPGSPMRHCYMQDSCALFSNNVKVCYNLKVQCAADAVIEGLNIAKHDILYDKKVTRTVLVFAETHHDGCSEEAWSSLPARIQQMRRGQGMDRVFQNLDVVFKDFSPQHFQTDAGNGTFVKWTDSQCIQSLENAPRTKREQETFVHPVLQELGWSRLRTYDNDAEHGDLHSEMAWTNDDKNDCTHWLMPGVPDTWAKQLYRHLLEQHGW